MELHRNRMDDSQIIIFCRNFLQKNTSLLKLGLFGNLITFKGAKYLSEVISNHPVLTDIDLRSNKIGDSGAEFLSEILKQNRKLKVLAVAANGLTIKGFTFFKLALQHNYVFTSFGIDANVPREVQKLLNRNQQLYSILQNHLHYPMILETRRIETIIDGITENYQKLEASQQEKLRKVEMEKEELTQKLQNLEIEKHQWQKKYVDKDEVIYKLEQGKINLENKLNQELSNTDLKQSNFEMTEKQQKELQNKLEEAYLTLNNHQNQSRETQKKQDQFLQTLANSLEISQKDLEKKENELRAATKEREYIIQGSVDQKENIRKLERLLQKTEQEKAKLSCEIQALELQHESLKMRMKSELSMREEATIGLSQVTKLLKEAKEELENQEREWKSKQEKADLAAVALQKAQQSVASKAELLETQLRIFAEYGLPPEEKAFQTFLGDSKRLFKRYRKSKPSCFISYAWEDIRTEKGKHQIYYFKNGFRELRQIWKN